MTNPRKLIIWLFLSALFICLLRMGMVESADQYIYALRNNYLPDFAYRYDDYLPYLPIIVMVGLKISGVRSRSGWKQMLVSTIFSFVLMGIVVLSMKSLAGVLRPDNSDLLSFPSGHTATAFTATGLLCKEYGYKNRWIAAIIYLPAILTGLSRQLNNRHWLSDVLAGATIGIMMVEVGYFLTDFLFKKKVGVNKNSTK